MIEKLINSNSPVLEEKKAKISENRVSRIIKKFNKKILNSKKTRYSLNTGLDNVPLLTEDEFLILKKIANEQGWKIEMCEDNYQTHSYHLNLNK